MLIYCSVFNFLHNLEPKRQNILILPCGVPPGEFRDINPGDDRGGPDTGVPGLLLPGPSKMKKKF